MAYWSWHNGHGIISYGILVMAGLGRNRRLQGIFLIAFRLWPISYGILAYGALVITYWLWHIGYGILVMAGLGRNRQRVFNFGACAQTRVSTCV